MNQGQEKFYQFIMERVQEDKAEDAKALLEEHFRKQQEVGFTKDDIRQFIPKMTALLKPDHRDEVSGIMKEFAEKHGE